MAVFASISSPVSKFTRVGVLATAIWGGLAGIPAACARETTDRGTSIALAELPPQGQQTYRTILQGGPFPHEKDGTVFGNRERLLPRETRGYYREYTVRTPGASNRGARRIVCGGQQPSRPDGCWYTADHYASFRRIVP